MRAITPTPFLMPPAKSVIKEQPQLGRRLSTAFGETYVRASQQVYAFWLMDRAFYIYFSELFVHERLPRRFDMGQLAAFEAC
jgi:hypothetical protein